jgi:hypothetical protein
MKIYLNCEDNPISFNKKNYLIRADKRVGLDIFEEWDPRVDADFVLNVQPYNNLERGKVWTGAWWIDTLLDNPRFNTEFPFIDDIFLAGTSHKIIPKDNHHLLFQAIDIDLYHPLPIEKDCDFILAGSMGLDIYKKREEIIDKLRKEGFKFIGAGKGFKPARYIEQLNRARVQFIRSMDVDGHGEIAQRFFECLAIGPVLTNWVDDLKKTNLIEGEDYLAYRSNEEAISLMHKLLDDPFYAAYIAVNGRRKALLHHTYEDRIREILKTIYERPIHK